MKHSSLLAGCCALTLGAISTASFAENLSSVYQEALANDPTFKEAEATWMAAKENLPISLSNLLPNLSVGTGVNRNYTKISGSSTDYNTDKQYSITLSQPIINFASWANISSTKASVKAAAATYAAAAQDLMSRTATDYFAVLQANDQLTFTLAQKRAIARQLQIAKQKYRAGATAITALYQAQSSYDAILATEISNRNILATSLQTLSTLTGRTYSDLEAVGEKIPLVIPDPKNMAQWVEMAEKQNPQIKAQQFMAIAAHESIKQQQAGFLPTLSGTGSYTYNSNNPALDSSSKMGSIGVSLNLPVYNGGSTLAQTRQARYNYVNASAGVEYTHRSIVAQTRQSYLTIIAQISQIKADAQAIKSAKNAFEATEAGFQAGTQTMLNVLDDLSSLYQTRQQYANDRYQYIMSIIKLKQAAGILKFEDLEEINRWLKQPVYFDDEKKIKKQTVHSKSQAKSKPESKLKSKSKKSEKANEKQTKKLTAVNRTYTLQIYASRDQEAAKAFIQEHTDQPLQLANHEVDGEQWYIVGYGSYNSVSEAEKTLKTLPTEFSQFNAWVAPLTH